MALDPSLQSMQITKVSEYRYFSKRKGEEVGKGDYSDT